MRPPPLLLLLTAWCAAAPVAAQSLTYDPGWYDRARPYVKIAVAHDGIYRITGDALAAAGVPIERIDPTTLRLLENGREIPLVLENDGALAPSDQILFVGRRNRGTSERWAYEGFNRSFQSSAFYSLYTDTTYYWLTWDGSPGRRYERVNGDPAGPAQTTIRTTLHREADRRYHYGDPDEVGRPLFTRGEGYYWHQFGEGRTRTYTLSLDRLATGSNAEAHLRVRFNGKTAAQHRVMLEVELSGTFMRVDVAEWTGYQFRTLQATLSAADLPTDGTLRLRLTSTTSDGGSPNSVLLDWIEVDYVRRLEARQNAQHFTVQEDGTHTFELTGYAGGPVYVLNPNTGRLILREASGSVRFSDTAPDGTTYWTATASGFRTPAALRYRPPGSRPDWTSTAHQADYVILTTRALKPSAQQLAAYRRAHDGFRVALVLVRDVFDQFDYGRPTPLAIRRFVHHTQDWATPPRFLALWGDATYPVRGETNRPDAPWNVPTFGYAPSDGWYAMQYDGDALDAYTGPPDEEWRPVLAVGRIPLRTNEQGRTYLKKLRTYESAPLRDWQKRMLLLSGGTSITQQNQLQAYSREWARIAAAAPTGADTIYFAKQTDDALDTSFQDSLSTAFERGASWINYFGHSAAQTWAIVTEPPSEYNNAGRLPFVVSLGCQTGAFAGGLDTRKDPPSFGEQLLLGLGAEAPPTASGTTNGAIAHFGTSYLGSIGASSTINDALVEAVFQDTVRAMGRAVQAAKAKIAANYFRRRLYVDHILQYSLLGDPAAHLALPTRPDLHLSPAQLSFTPLTPTPSDVLHLTVHLENQGLVPADSVKLSITHTAPTGEEETITHRLAPFSLERTVRHTTLLTGQDVGRNRFRVAADPDRRLAEADESNNTAEVEQLVFSTGLEIISPRPFGLVTSRRPTLRFSVTTTEKETRTILLELDDEASFDTPIARARVQTETLLAEWRVSSRLSNRETYYWRARLAGNEESATWRTGAFTVRTNLSSGFLQQGALLDANTRGTQLIRQKGTWRFSTYELEVTTYSEKGRGRSDYGFNVGGTRNYVYLGLGFRVMIMDGATGQVKASGSFCTYKVTRDAYRQTQCKEGLDGPAAVDLLATFLNEHLSEGDYLFVGTRHLARASSATIPESVKEIFRPYSKAIDTLTYHDLWILQAHKGFPEESVELANATTNDLLHQTRFQFRYLSGQTTSPLIGPARQWGRLTWTAQLKADDALRVDVLTADGDSILVRGLHARDLPYSLAGLSARRHPFLRLRATLSDSTDRTAPQLRAWHLTYQSPAELALDARGLQLSADTLAEAQNLHVTVPLHNLSTNAPADTVVVRYAVTDAANVSRTVAADTLFALTPGATDTTTATLGTLGRLGDNVLRITARQPGSPEPLTFNNTLVKRFFVQGDRQPPNLRVLIDGRALPPDFEPLRNTQAPGIPYISAHPTIEITVDDENPFRPLTRPDYITLYLDCNPEDPLTNCVPATDTTFRPAQAAKDPARVLFTPNLSKRDTAHTLRVFVRDASGNVTGEKMKPSYQVHFRVQTELAIRDLYPYPNPMSTHTTFAFLLKGSDASKITDLRIRIYTLTGRLIREFDLVENPMLLEAGGLRIGWNKVPWNGTDADGDHVATGIYLYKVFVDSTDGSIEVNSGNVEKIAVIR